jgi:TRAP-type C4-dicarboxylate transport system permease small subunit
MKTIRAIVINLSGIMYVIAGIALIGMVTLTVADVILRIFRSPIMGTYELVGLLGAIMVSFAIPQTSRAKGHVVMDFLQGKLPIRVDRAFHIITRLLGIGLFIIIGWQLWLLGADYQRMTEVTVTLHLPQYPFCYGMAVCCFVQCAELFLEIFQPPKQEQQS